MKKAAAKKKRKLIVISFLTLDGVMQAPGGKTEDPAVGFKYGGWQMEFRGDDYDLTKDANKAGALLLGRKTYDIFAGYWPNEGKDMPGWGKFMNNIPKYVASKTLRKVEWQNSTLLKGDVGKAVEKLKNEPGKDIYMFGSGDLCQTLMRKKLIDEYLLMIHPLTLGHGKRLFREDGPRQDLELVKSQVLKAGIFVATYKVKK